MTEVEQTETLKAETPDIEILLGQYLKEKRQGKNFSLEKLSQKTKISVNILKHLENNDFDHLPSAAYIKGFVKSYVRVLALPMDEAINKMEFTYLKILGKPFPALNHTKLLDNTVTPQAKESQPQASTEILNTVETIVENTRSFLPFIILVAILGFFIGGYQLISSIVDKEAADQKSKDLGPKIEPSSALLLKGKAPEEKKDNSGNQDSKEATAEVTPPVPEKTFERNFPTVEFKKVKGTLFSLNRESEENKDLSILPQDVRNQVNLDLQNVYIKAVGGNTWLSYKIDGRPIESSIINQGSGLFLQGSEVRIFLGNSNVTKIFYNNVLIDAPTKSGVKSLIFPQESNEKYLLPLFPKAKDDVLYTAEDYLKRMNVEEEEIKRRQ
jgi:cytoskeleton protein RodZ